MSELSASLDVLDVLNPVTPPDLTLQARDTSRNNPVTYVVDDGYMGTRTSDPRFRKMRRETTEYKALNEFLYFMEMVEPYVPDHIKDDARELRNELVFLCMSELHFAATALAKRLRRHLEVDDKLVYVDVGDSLSQCRDRKEMKSSQYILSLVLSKFSKDEFKECKGKMRIYDGVSKIEEESKIVFIDDWIIGGNQMRERFLEFNENNETEDHEVSVLVMAASDYYIENGISKELFLEDTLYPVEACYRLKTSPDAWGESRVTGIHSSTDAKFGHELDDILFMVIKNYIRNNKGIDKLSMPALANIVRPYRNGEDFDGLSRLRQLQSLER